MMFVVQFLHIYINTHMSMRVNIHTVYPCKLVPDHIYGKHVGLYVYNR